jgi:Zn-dependent peptidase ImmA (M78 family)
MMGQSGFKRAESMLEELGIESPEDIDVEAIAQYCGATVIYQKLVGCEARILGYGERAIIAVNESSPRPRQRFSVGHELGHWMNDRGRPSFACEAVAFATEWSAANPEQIANQYAADILIPVKLLAPLAKNRPVTFETTKELAARFQTSLTAMAIRLVEYGSFPSMVVCNRRVGRVWFRRGPDVPEVLWPTEKVDHRTVAYDLLHGKQASGRPVDLRASAWFDIENANEYLVREDSVRIADDLVLTVLWWADERQLLDLEEDS